MFNIHRNEKGITLVELLAVFVISGIVVMLIIGVHIFTQKQFQTQTEDAQRLTDVTIAMKEITKDIRSRDVQFMESSDIPYQELNFADGKTYKLENDVLLKDNHPYIYYVKEFDIEFSKDSADDISIYIESITGQQIETTLVVR